MDSSDQFQELRERIEFLERKLSNISFHEAKEVILTNCPIGDISVGNDCKLDFKTCSIGGVIDADIEEADSRIEDLESRLDEINDRIDETESRLDEIRDTADE